MKIFNLLLLLPLLIFTKSCETKKAESQSIISLVNYLRPSSNNLKYEILKNDSIVVYESRNNGYHPVFSIKSTDEFDEKNFFFENKTYTNPCIQDGELFELNIIGNNQNDTVKISNYYHKNLDSLILYLNKNLPKKHQIYYNKDRLVQQLNNCKN